MASIDKKYNVTEQASSKFLFLNYVHDSSRNIQNIKKMNYRMFIWQQNKVIKSGS
jgi:hypothetical protein